MLMNNAPLPPSLPKRKTGLAITSLVLGILGLTCFWIFTGIPAIVCGVIARKRARENPEEYGGAGLALAGVITGSVSFVSIVVLAGLFLPAIAKAKEKAQRIACVSHLKVIGSAARMWANDHKDTFPPDFQCLSNEVIIPNVLICPADTVNKPAAAWSEVGPKTSSYQYLLPGAKADASAAEKKLVICPIHNNACYGDGSVRQETVPARTGPR